MTRAQHRLILIGSWRGAQTLLERAVTAPAPLEVLACRAPLQWALMGTRAHCPTRVHARETFLRAPQAERALPRHRAPDAGAAGALEARLAWRYPFADAAALPSKAAVERARAAAGRSARVRDARLCARGRAPRRAGTPAAGRRRARVGRARRPRASLTAAAA